MDLLKGTRWQSSMTTSADFNQWLQKGLGRAVVYLRTHDPQPYREAVLYACTHDLAYDSQCESRSEVYLLDLIRSVGDDQFFRNGLFRALTTEPTDPERFDLGQTVEVARTFADKGDVEVRQAMYDAVVRAGFEKAGRCYTDLIKLDGLDALIFAADNFPSSTIHDDDLWQVNVLITALEEREGVEAANLAIDRASHELPRLRQMLEMAKASNVAHERQLGSRARPDYESLRTIIASGETTGSLYGWGRTASTEELEAAAGDLIRETDEARIIAYLGIFRWGRFPRPIGRLLELARNSNIRIARGAINVLSQLTDPAIRALALSLMAIPERRGDAVDLLVSNYEAGDFQRIEAMLREPMNADDVHHLGMGVRHLLKAHRSPDAESCLLLLYENGPCSLCRGEIVEHLIALGRLPDGIREECRRDADVETRKLVS
jgi:hypothetical protein